MVQLNEIRLVGTVIENPTLKYTDRHTSYYKIILQTTRDSGYPDCVPIVLSENLLNFNCNQDLLGKQVKISGTIRTRTRIDFEDVSKKHLEVYVLAKEFKVLEEKQKDENVVYLEGNLSHKVNVRRTPLGKTIADMILKCQVNIYRKCRIPCIAWNRIAYKLQKEDDGSLVLLKGRFQSREYTKKISETESEVRIAYEISIIEVYN